MNVDLSVVAHVLTSIGDPPGVRSKPRHGDLQGVFDRWFDGGAIKIVTGWTEYHFEDGTVGIVPTTPGLRVEIRLPTGAYVSVTEQSEAPPHFDLYAV